MDILLFVMYESLSYILEHRPNAGIKSDQRQRTRALHIQPIATHIEENHGSDKHQYPPPMVMNNVIEWKEEDKRRETKRRKEVDLHSFDS